MNTPHYSPIHQIDASRDISHFELETDTLLPDDIVGLEDIVGIPMHQFRVVTAHIVADVGDFIYTVISGVSRF